jgi:thiol:disulfide interchange protein DsbD
MATLSCGKHHAVPPALEWFADIDAWQAAATARKKTPLVFVVADWDTASKEYDAKTFADPEVRRLLHDRFVALRIDGTDDESPTSRYVLSRFRVQGIPTIVAFAPDCRTELWRVTNYEPPDAFAKILRTELSF